MPRVTAVERGDNRAKLRRLTVFDGAGVRWCEERMRCGERELHDPFGIPCGRRSRESVRRFGGQSRGFSQHRSVFADCASDRREDDEQPEYGEYAAEHRFREVVENPAESQVGGGYRERVNGFEQVHPSRVDLHRELLKRLLKHKELVKLANR